MDPWILLSLPEETGEKSNMKTQSLYFHVSSVLDCLGCSFMAWQRRAIIIITLHTP